MSKYAGTQTEKNLEAAFAGESQARNKYTYYASKAKKDGFEQIASASKEATDNAESCQSAIRDIEEMSRSVVSNSETVSAATEEQSASVHEMNTNSEQLAKMAGMLQDEVQKFKV